MEAFTPQEVTDAVEAGVLHTTYLDVPLIRQDVMMPEEKIQEFLLRIGL